MYRTGTPYDDVFHTLLNDCRQLVIPLVNAFFGESFGMGEPVTLLQNEHYMNLPGGVKERITDSCFSIRGRRYHIECQSTPDGSMLIRMFEYDSRIALEQGRLCGDRLEMEFPESAVLYLRSGAGTPDAMTVTIRTSGGSVSYRVPVLKMEAFTLDEILEKKLYFLIPFYLFTFESRFDIIESDRGELEKLKQEYMRICDALERLTREGVISEFTERSIAEMTKKVADALAGRHRRVKEGVNGVMGGKILTYPAKKYYLRGIQKGIKKGILQGRHEGIQEGILQGRHEGIREGIIEGMQKGREEAGMLCYLNALNRGMSEEDARSIAGITEKEAVRAVKLREEGKL